MNRRMCGKRVDPGDARTMIASRRLLGAGMEGRLRLLKRAD